MTGTASEAMSKTGVHGVVQDRRTGGLFACWAVGTCLRHVLDVISNHCVRKTCQRHVPTAEEGVRRTPTEL